MEDSYYPVAALNTLVAPWWKLRLARLLGKKSVFDSLDGTVILYRWRGVIYMWDYTPAKEQTQ